MRCDPISVSLLFHGDLCLALVLLGRGIEKISHRVHREHKGKTTQSHVLCSLTLNSFLRSLRPIFFVFLVFLCALCVASGSD